MNPSLPNNQFTKKKIKIREASAITGYHPQSLYRFAREGLITKRKTRSGGVYFYEEDLDNFMDPKENSKPDLRRLAAKMVDGSPGIRHNVRGNGQSHLRKGGVDV